MSAWPPCSVGRPGCCRRRRNKGRDPAAEAQCSKRVPAERPEQKLTEHDRSPQFDPTKPAPLTPALKDQPKEGRITGFDFARDPLNADKPFTTFDEVMKKESAAKPKVMAAQRKLLESRYDLDAEARPEGEDVARQAALRRPDRPAGRRA